MRLLIVGGSSLIAWLVRRQVPADVEVGQVLTLDEAKAAFAENPPDAVLLEVMPSSGPWREVAAWCDRHQPPIPVLYHAGAYLDSEEIGLPRGNGTRFTRSLEPGVLDRLLHAAEAAVG